MKIVYIDNYDSFANTIAAYFEEEGADIAIYKSDSELDVIEKAKPDMILLGPGPNSPKESGNYTKAIEIFHKKIPIFGICLGFQAIMHYFGSEIIQLKEIVHGSASPIIHDNRTIFDGIEQKEKFARYHSLGVEKVPGEFEITAKAGDVIMGARHKKLPIEGVLFHPESILSMNNNSGKKLIQNVVRYYESFNTKTDR